MNLSVYPSYLHSDPSRGSAMSGQSHTLFPGQTALHQNALHLSGTGIHPAEKNDPHEAAKQSAFARRLRQAAEEANQLKPAAKTSKKEEKTTTKKKLSYNFKEISAQIFRAKNAVAAGKAVSQAKRKVVELKRKLAAKDADEEEIAIALNHAKRMEIAARRKQRHLEIEEYAKNHLDQEAEDSANGDAAASLLSQAEERLIEGQEEVLAESEEERKAMKEALAEELAAAEAKAQSEEQAELLSAEMQEEMQAFFDDAEEEAMEMLEETLVQIEGLEMASPHMSEEDFKEMVQKHRHSEQKEITRADMDYLKSMISYLYEKGGNENCFTALSSAPQSSFVCNVSFEG
ncbi:MAG: hypothetical protein IJJ13_08760 [Lachnospiraceae bacterium]|nr:hypothetical protein [Lachnospiraceae bacterium]